MAHPLRAGVHAVAIHRDLVILDMEHDDYFCVVDALDSDDAGEILGGDTVAALADGGLLSGEPTQAVPVQALYPALMRDWRDLPLPDAVHVRPIDMLRFLGALLWSLIHFRRHHLPGLLRLHPSRQPGHATLEEPMMLARAVHKFQAMLTWLPVRPLCLRHSFLLLRFLKRSGLAADWVFGVQLYPFQAHCWLACGDFVVGDEAHRLGAYHPIMIHPGHVA